MHFFCNAKKLAEDWWRKLLNFNDGNAGKKMKENWFVLDVGWGRNVNERQSSCNTCALDKKKKKPQKLNLIFFFLLLIFAFLHRLLIKYKMCIKIVFISFYISFAKIMKKKIKQGQFLRHFATTKTNWTDFAKSWL